MIIEGYQKDKFDINEAVADLRHRLISYVTSDSKES
jgi:hypothetical protein